MARREPPVKRSAELTPDQLQAGISRLGKVLDRVRQFEPQSVTDQFAIPHVEQLSAAIDDALVRTFGPDSLEYDRYIPAIHFDNGPFNAAFDVPIQEVHRSLARSKASNIVLLEQAIETLNERLAEAGVLASSSQNTSRSNAHESRKVFLVHGRDDAAKNEVALFLRAIGLEPIILHLRPNGGRHLLTKFREELEGAGFAVILMMPEDEGGLAGTVDLRPRARQNVVFELGFFIGKLGPANVAALLKGDVEKPSDFDGIAYIPFDLSGRWKMDLARELHHAKVPFDPAKALTA